MKYRFVATCPYCGLPKEVTYRADETAEDLGSHILYLVGGKSRAVRNVNGDGTVYFQVYTRHPESVELPPQVVECRSHDDFVQGCGRQFVATATITALVKSHCMKVMDVPPKSPVLTVEEAEAEARKVMQENKDHA
jgi:hypothetical protein